ncbi:hypothetical protein QZH41_013482 [Actinostola sp. cb2023]|nr:hypothetical protein QZH41_013482 [Actinostola sp. cb2023]
MEIFETIYEDMTIKNGQTLNKSTKTQRNLKECFSLDAVYREYEDMRHDEAEEDIYEVIPADFAPCSWSEKSSRSSSISSQGSSRNERICGIATVGIQTDDESISPSASPNTTAPISQDVDDATHYAEILHANDLEITEITPSRPTRESDNPILRQDFAQLTDSKLLASELQSIRNSFAGTSKLKRLDSQGRYAKELPAHLLLKRSLSAGDNRGGLVRKSVDVLYESSPHHSPPVPHRQSASAPVYENIKFPFIESDRESHSSTSSSCADERSSSSEEASAINVESLYENVDDYADESRARTSSHPIDIVYSDLQFHGEKKLQQHVVSFDREELDQKPRKVESLSAASSSPNPPSPRGTGRARPKSLNIRSRVTESLGLCSARFVKKISVQRSNDKTLQATICEVLAKSNDVDDEPFVNVEVNSDIVRISTDFPPWEVIASCDVETVGHVNLYEGDDKVLGIIVCPLGEESTCYIIRSQQAKHILETIKSAFRAPNLRQFNLCSSPEGTSPSALPGHESFTSIPHITYLGCVKVKQSYLVINDSILALLEKINPRDFKPITLKIRPEEILVVDESNQNTLHHHSISWVLSLGVLAEDPRLFGYIVTEARQGEKTRMFCHAFRCGRITGSVTASETIRLACQATFCPGRKDSVRLRRDSQRSCRSSFSSDVSSSLERRCSLNDVMEVSDQSSTNERRDSHDSGSNNKVSSPGRLFRKLTPKKNFFTLKSSFRSYTSEPNLTSLTSSPTEENPTPDSSPIDCPEIVEEKEFTFRTAYLCSTVINPPLRPKHVRDSVKQYLKECKKMEKRTGTPPTMKEIELCITSDGVTMLDPQCRHVGQRFFPFPCISNVRTHKDYPGYFAFSTVVTGDAKHKCHIYKQVKEPCDEITAAFESFLWEKV